jgi:dTDP-3-amino-3,4,6-trideoxy-alpha-D-glucose transaminase
MHTIASAAVPFFDGGPSHAGLTEAILDDIAALVDENAFTNGPAVAAFEAAFADFCAARFCVGTSNGLDALRLGLLASGLESGDEVVVPANTFVATFEAVTQAGGRPVPVDVSESDYNLDPAAAAAAISTRTRILLPVHLYGQPADLVALAALAERAGLEMFEDACQAPGATRDGVRAGSASTAAFSFYPAKNLGAFGDAGALVTGSAQLAERVRALREHGQRVKYHHEVEGYTARLDTIQAVVLLHKLPHLERWNEERRSVARVYLERLDGVGDLVLPPVVPGSDPVWHLFVIRTADPGALAASLAEDGIGTGRHYPEPAHLSTAYEWLGYGRGAFPVAERLAREVLSLPIFPGMSEEQVDAVVAGVARFFRRGR